MAKVVRAADLSLPRRISGDDFSAICATFKIAPTQRQQIRDLLNEAVDLFAEVMAGKLKKGEPSRRADRQNLDRIKRKIDTARHGLASPRGAAGREALAAAGRPLGEMLSAAWLRNRFPEDRLAPDPDYSPLRTPPRRSNPRHPGLRTIDVDQISEDCKRFAAARPAQVLSAILAEISEALTEARQRIIALPDGRKPLEHRQYFLAALAEMWHRLGRRPTAGRNSQYGSFCESVLDAIGWPTDGVNAALSDAIVLWRRLYQR